MTYTIDVVGFKDEIKSYHFSNRKSAVGNTVNFLDEMMDIGFTKALEFYVDGMSRFFVKPIGLNKYLVLRLDKEALVLQDAKTQKIFLTQSGKYIASYSRLKNAVLFMGGWK